jgi:hypothetical protein
MSGAKLGARSQLKLGAGSPLTYTKIAEVLQIGAITETTTEVDVTNLDSDAKEYIGGLPDGGTLDFKVNWLAGNVQQQALRDGVGTTKQFQLEWSDESGAAFSMVVLGFTRDETSPETQMTATIQGRITGAITWS